MKRNKRLDYTLIAEGYAEYKFIPIYLRHISNQMEVQAVRSSLGLKGKQSSKSKVLQDAGRLCNSAIQQNHHLFIIGVDLDKADHESEQLKHKAECDKIISALEAYYKKYRDRIILFVPVQAIEHWMTYQAYQVGLTEKYPNNGLESKPQHDLKQILYGQKEDGATMERVAEKIAEKADFDELAKQSRSFNHFHQQVVTFLTAHKTTQP